MRGPYPETAPFAQGWLDVGDGHRVYWEERGHPDGKPAVVLHGGPGSGCTTQARYFDPARWRVVLFDQRNCGRSTPHASEPHVDLSANTTEHLLGDIEALRRHRGIERWLVFGGSWGSTLGTAYAVRHPERVSEAVLTQVALTTPGEVDWITRGVRLYLPEAWERFRDGVPEADRGGDLADAYHRLLMSSDAAVREKAARDWCDWEIALVSLHADINAHPRYDDPRFRLCFARLVTQYFRSRAWIEDGALLRGATSLGHIPAILIHGRLDLGSPLATAWALSKAWPGAELIPVANAGHDGRDPGMAEAMLAAIERFADRR